VQHTSSALATLRTKGHAHTKIMTKTTASAGETALGAAAERADVAAGTAVLMLLLLLAVSGFVGAAALSGCLAAARAAKLAHCLGLGLAVRVQATSAVQA
jgi:hypothetical protein